MYNKQSTNQYLNIPVILSYFWNGSKNIITGKIKSNDYFLMFKKIESNNIIKIRYSQIDKIEIMPEISENNMLKVKQLESEAEIHKDAGKYDIAAKRYNAILKIIRPNTFKYNRIKNLMLDCEINDSLTDGSMELRDNLKEIS